MHPQDELHEERINAITYGLGVILSLLGVPFLMYAAFVHGRPVHIWGAGIFSASLVLMYILSTTYHSVHHPEKKRLWQILDHIGIYYLIAGSYTPFLLFFVEEPSRTIYLGIMWGIALAGTVFKLFFTGKFEYLSTGLYLLMGWMVIFIGEPVFRGLSVEGLTWLFLGGAGYTFGVLFFLWRSLRFHHAIWHVFVLIGSTCHFFAVWWALYASFT